MNPGTWMLPTAIVAALALATGATLVASRAAATGFNWVVYVAANLIVFIDMIDFAMRLYFRRTCSARNDAGAATETSVTLASRARTPYQRQSHLRPYALVVSVHDAAGELDDFLEAMAPYREHLWVIDDASTDDTALRIRQAGWRCLDGGHNRKKPGAIRALLDHLPPEIETVMVMDPDTSIRDVKRSDLSHLENIILDFQRSGMAAMCPRIAIKEDGLLSRHQSLEYAMAFGLGRFSLADRSITSGIAIYRRDALCSVFNRHSMSVYAEDLENAVILLAAGNRVYYDGRLVVETDGVADWRRWFSQRVGWSYGLIKVYFEHFGEIVRTGCRSFIAGYQFFIYMGVFCLLLQPLKLLALLLLAASALSAVESFLGLNVVPAWASISPIYFLTAYVKYSLLSALALFLVVPRADRRHALPIVPLYFFYAMAQVVPVTIGYANWLALRLAGRRVFKDHYQDETSMRHQNRISKAMEQA